MSSFMHGNLLIVGILTIGLALASFFSYIMQRVKLPAILGYLLAGYLIGPYSPGFVANAAIAEQLAEVGVILMLFGVGLHFKVEDLIRVKKIAIPGAIGQTLIATICAAGIFYSMEWSIGSGIIVGLSIGVASTVVLVRMLSDHNILNTPKGHIAIGWLVVEDIFTVIILILLPTVAVFSMEEKFSIMSTIQSAIWVIGKFFILVLFMFTLGHKIIDYILTSIVRLRSQELFTLTILALVFLIATVSSVVFGTSIALGAFIAGMVIGKTHVRHQAASNALPLKDVFLVVFFLSVGMLFNPMAIVTHFTLFIEIVAVILIVKPLVAYFITVSLGHSLNVALTVAISLAQIGEFSFILAEEAIKFKLIPDEGFDILVACALISISLNPILFQRIGYLESRMIKLPVFKRLKNTTDLIKEKEKHSLKVVVIGFGPIGKEVVKILKNRGFTPIIVEQNIDTVSSQEKHNMVLFGDATEASILKDACIEEASHLVITIPDTEKIIKIIWAARQVRPDIQIVARIQYIEEKDLFKDINVTCICTESEALKSFSSLISELFKPVSLF